MAFTAAQVMTRASTILQDAGAIRWTPVELCDWLNEALRAIVTIKPNAKAGNVFLTMSPGTRQELPESYTILSRVIRNIRTGPGIGPLGMPGRAIRQLARREMLDAMIPDWHNPDVLPYSDTVSYVWQDLMATREYWVAPGNTGNGRIEATVGMIPQEVAIPANPLDIASYDAPVDLHDLYQPIVLDFILFRAFAKDSGAPDAAQRSALHLQLASQGLSAMGTGQSSVSLATAYAPPGAAG